MRVSLHDGIGGLELALQSEANLVLRSLRAALNALETADEELASEVVAADLAIDRASVDLHESIYRLLACQSPLAVDLRLVLAMLHVNLHLERAGDECVTIAKLVRLTAELPREPGCSRASRRWAPARRRCSGSRSTAFSAVTPRVAPHSSISTT